jgi:aspartate/methionine/tyrosine aminotransferase
MLKPGCDWLPADWIPNAAMRKAMRNLGRANDTLLSDYGSTLGALNLRRLLSRQIANERIAASPEQILLTSSGTQAIDLICRLLLRPGETVLVDDPCYFNFQALLRAPSGRRDRRALYTKRAGYSAIRTSSGRAQAAPLHHQLSASQPNGRNKLAPDGTPDYEHGHGA